MSTNFHEPIVAGESNSPDTINARLSTLDAAIGTSIAAIQEAVETLIIESGTSDAETIAARTAIPYAVGSPPDTLGEALSYTNGEVYNVKAFGAKGDAIQITNATISGGTTTFTSVSNPFTSADVGKTVVIDGAGALAGTSGNRLPLVTTIATYVGPGMVTLAAQAAATVSGVRATIGTDDSLAVQAACNAMPSGGGQLYFPPGRYLLATQTVIGEEPCIIPVTKRMRIFGAGDSSVLDFSGTTRRGIRVDGVNGVVIENLSFYGLHQGSTVNNEDGTVASAIFLNSNAHNCTVQNCYFERFWGGAIRNRGARGSRILNNRFVNIGNREGGVYYGAILLSNSENVVIAHNDINQTGLDNSGITLATSSINNIVHGNVIRMNNSGSASMGIYVLNGSSYNVISNNYIYGSADECIVLIGGTTTGPVVQNLVIGNRIENWKYAGVSVQRVGTTYEVGRNHIIGNTFAFVGGYVGGHGAVSINAATNNHIANNTMHNVTTNGVIIYNPDGVGAPHNNTVVGNTVIGSGSGTGITLTGAQGTMVHGNSFRNLTTAISLGSTQFNNIRDNSIQGCTNGITRNSNTDNSTQYHDNWFYEVTNPYVNIDAPWHLFTQVLRPTGSNWTTLTISFSVGNFSGGFFEIVIGGRCAPFNDVYCRHTYSFATASGTTPQTTLTAITANGATLTVTGATIPASGGGNFTVPLVLNVTMQGSSPVNSYAEVRGTIPFTATLS